MNSLFMLVSIAILSQVQGEIPSRISCSSSECSTAFEFGTNFQTAVDMCQRKGGHLMTVRSSASNEAIRDLFTDIKGDFWIGLQFDGKGCTDTSSTMKQYKWITGDTPTDFTNWSNKNSESFCVPMCVSVSRDLKWKERPCHDNIDGFLCESSYDFICDPLEPIETDESVVYITPLGNEGEGATSLPPGSLVTRKPSGIRYICAPESGWLRAPWPCEVEKGGCEHECVMSGKPQCTCPAGQALQSNKVTCSSTPLDPCVNLGCEHICLSSKRLCLCRNGYELREDGKGCRDIDECRDKRICTNSNCVNTMGSYECHCAAGFKKENGICEDINECSSSPCEHECVNTEGSYVCSSFEGHILSADDHTASELHCDKPECSAKCDINNPAECMCPHGYILDFGPKDEPVCLDIDECEINFCSHNCSNTFGGFICTCPAGFKLRDGWQCVVEYGSGSTSPPLDTSPSSDTVSPTSSGTTNVTTTMTLLGIAVCILLMILIFVFQVFYMWKQHSSIAWPPQIYLT